MNKLVIKMTKNIKKLKQLLKIKISKILKNK